MSAEAYQAAKWEREIEERNRPLSDEELDAILPPEGFKVLDPPGNYQPIRTPARKAMSTPTPIGGTPMYSLPTEDRGQAFDVPAQLEGLPDMKPEDQQYFGALLKVRRVAVAPLGTHHADQLGSGMLECTAASQCSRHRRRLLGLRHRL